ncbi:unnamed protein product [Acanthoscelides obtectus]|uniref:Centromere protein S n=1 Tax=Acanthoscelides obtectus TaxID=200917 RepID=A0A9P0MC53_ACAOB|nr:unnamed protein product [Acanthoscelides obtectus]CAK1646664.1 Centromere protein S [Acanthoscelides obtectus]
MSNVQKTKHSIYNTARKLSKEVAADLKVEFHQDVLDIIAELVYKKLVLYGSDLDAFQKHAKRSTITADDVKLLVRRSETLKTVVESKMNLLSSLKPAEAPTAVKRKRK